MKKVLILTANHSTLTKSTRPTLSRLLARHPEAETDAELELSSSAFDQLDFYVDGDHTFIRDHAQDFDLADFDLVLIRGVGRFKEELTAVITYLDVKQIPVFDTNSIHDTGKLARAYAHWAAGLPIPRTAAGTPAGLAKILAQIGTPAVLKATKSNRGEHNHLIHSSDELERIITAHPDRQFLLQQFIPNQGDYRVLVVDFEQPIVTLRRGQGDTHLNNVSAGGSETLITDTSDLQPVIDLARAAARVDNLRFAGVDIITDQVTGQHYVLEDNQFPQVTLDAEIDGLYQVIRGAL
jgi:glutathione synthase/RimK-type ligase-like ATP-grasp enzyme